jgi:CRISPR-associated protein Csy1
VGLIRRLHNIKVAGFFIGDLLREGGQEYLKVFTKNEELLKYWVGSFTRYIKNEEKKSYFLSKQVYFPIANKQYHLLLPLTSSSLVHELHLEQKKYFEEDQTLARKQKSDKKYSLVETCTYPNKAYLHVTGSNHSNASSLNGKRGGRIALLPTMPPQWKSRLPSYVNKHNIFDKTLAFELRAEINELRDYLLLIKNKSLSISEPKRNATVINKLQAISNQLFNYLEKINDNESQDGWTIGSKLPDEQQLMFEPCREDVAIKILKTNYQWQKKLSKTYGRWLNKQLTQKDKLNLTLIQESLWANVFLIELREYIATQEVIL